MKKLWLIPVAIIGLLLIAIIALPSLVPTSVYQDKITDQLSSALGREVSIGDEIKLSVLPNLQAKANKVIIANPEGFTEPEFAQMQELRAKVKLLPLLSKRVEIAEFVLVSPHINLVKNKSGQTNWTIGSSKETPKVESGPFKRGAGFGDLDVSLGDISIIDGQISYADKTSGAEHQMQDVNLSLSLPALDQKIKANGDLIYQGEAMAIDLVLETPEDFMAGRSAPFELNFDSDLGKMSTIGAFSASEEIAFTITLDADIPSVDAAMALIPKSLSKDIPYTDLLETLRGKSEVTFDGKSVFLDKADIALKGPLLNASYEGALSTVSGANFSGKLNADVSDIPALLTAIGQDIPQAAIIKTATVSADVSGNSDNISIKNVDLKASDETIEASYIGDLTLGDEISLQGDFSTQIRSPHLTAQVLGMDIEALKAISNVTANGKLSGPISLIKASDILANVKGQGLEASFKGAFNAGQTPTLSGDFDTNIDSLSELAQTANITVPYSDIVGGFSANGSISGALSALSISSLNASLKDGILIASLSDAAAELGKAPSLSGNMSLSTSSVRDLAAKTGAQLPEGNIFGPFSLSGTVSGNTDNVLFENAALQFDKINGQGKFGIDLTGSKPNLTGNLDLDGLDLRPYATKTTSQKKSGGIAPWSEAPLDLSALKTVNGAFTLTTPNVMTNRLTLTDSKIFSTLKNGKLSARIPNTKLYDGTGTVVTVLDASQSPAAFRLNVDLDKLDAPQFLGASAGFDKVTGQSTTVLALTASGDSQAALMRSLSGIGSFDILNGSLIGVDLSALLTGLEDAIKQGAIPAGVGPGMTTTFSEILGKFEIRNGVVAIDNFNMQSNGVRADGAGTLDIGNQKIDFSLRPRLINGDQNGLASFGIPLKLKGDFGGVKPSLDTNLLRKILEDRAKAKAKKLVADEINKKLGSQSLGNVLGGILGGQKPETKTGPAQSPKTTPQKPAPTVNKKSDEDIAKELFKGIFGN